MTERAYITVDRSRFPRLVEVAEPDSGGSNQLVLQDLHDTLNSNTLPAGDPDDSLDNMDDDFLISSAGKEELGGGVNVGITSTLQDAQIKFAGNYTPAQTGSATSGDTNGELLTDSSAQFITNGVERGAWIVNFDDRSVAEVFRVLSETQLEHLPLQVGINNDWTVGDNYSIFNIVQKEISGGNLVAVDGVGDNLPAVFPTFATQVVRTSSSSATLQELEDIQFASFNGGVTIEQTSPYSGTSYPVGTLRQPVNNITDAIAIASDRGLGALYVIGNLAVASEDIRGFHIVGDSIGGTLVTVAPAARTEKTTWDTLTITGELDGNADFQGCILRDLTMINGDIDSCGFSGTILLTGTNLVAVRDCYSAAPETSEVTLDLGGAGPELKIHDYTGRLNLQNKTGAKSVRVGLAQGVLTLHESVQAGNITVNGVGTLVDQSTGNAVIDDLHLVDPAKFADAVLDVPQSEHEIAGTVGKSISQGGGEGGTGTAVCTATSPEFGKVLVDQDYGDVNNLVYTIDGIAVADALIEVFLLADYLSGKRDSKHRLGITRQEAGGQWELPFYLDPQTYVLQYHRQGVAGPDAFSLVVSEEPSEIAFTRLTLEPTPLPTPTPEPTPKAECDVFIDGLEAFSGVGTVLVDQDYSGPRALTYTVNGAPVQNADILIFTAEDYNAGKRSFADAVAASRQFEDGTWQQAVKLDPGAYVFQYYKQGVAGPDAYAINVTEG